MRFLINPAGDQRTGLALPFPLEMRFNDGQ